MVLHIAAQPLIFRSCSFCSEFDPYFNFRATQYLAQHGLDKFFKWFDHMSVSDTVYEPLPTILNSQYDTTY